MLTVRQQVWAIRNLPVNHHNLLHQFEEGSWLKQQWRHYHNEGFTWTTTKADIAQQ